MNLSSAFVVWKTLGLALQINIFFSVFPGLTSNKEEICIEIVYEGGFSDWTSLTLLQITCVQY